MARPALGPLVALLAVQVAFASLSVIGKYVLNAGVTPLLLMGLRVFFATVILTLIARATTRERPTRKDLWALLGLSLLGVTINQSLFLEGLDRTSAINAAVLIATIPVFTLLVAVLLRHETLDPTRASGVAVAFLGTLLVLRAEDFDWHNQFLVGNLLVVGNCLSFSIYLVLARPLLQRYRSSTVVAWTFLLGAFILAPLAVPDYSAAQASGLFTLPIVAALAWIVLVPSVLSYSLNNYALKRVRSSTVASFVFLQPLLAVALALALLPEERLEARTVVAGLLILAGVWLVARGEGAAPTLATGNPIKTEPSADERGGTKPQPQEEHP